MNTCPSCQANVSHNAMSCPACGHTLAVQKSKAGAVILAWFLGGLGLHRFYLGDVWIGVTYLIAFIASFAVPGMVFAVSLVAFVDGLIMLFKGNAYWRREVA